MKPSAFAAHMNFLEHVNAVHPLVTEDDNEGSAVGFVYNSFVAKGYSGRLSQDALEMIRYRPKLITLSRTSTCTGMPFNGSPHG